MDIKEDTTTTARVFAESVATLGKILVGIPSEVPLGILVKFCIGMPKRIIDVKTQNNSTRTYQRIPGGTFKSVSI